MTYILQCIILYGWGISTSCSISNLLMPHIYSKTLTTFQHRMVDHFGRSVIDVIEEISLFISANTCTVVSSLPRSDDVPWWRCQMETFSALLAICAGNSSVTGEFPAQKPVTRSFDVFFDQRLSKRLSKQSWGWWYETLSHSLWRHCNGLVPKLI